MGAELFKQTKEKENKKIEYDDDDDDDDDDKQDLQRGNRRNFGTFQFGVEKRVVAIAVQLVLTIVWSRWNSIKSHHTKA